MRERNHHHGLAITLHQSCVFYQLLKEHREVENQSTELISLTAEQGFAHWHATGTIFRGWCVAVRGDREAGLAEMRRGLAAKQATGSELTVPYYLGLIAAFTDETAKEDAMGLFADALGQVERTGERWFEAELHRLKGEVLLGGSAPSFADAEGELKQALTIARQQGARFWELRAATSLACLWLDQRKHKDAQRLLAPVYAWFAEGSDTPDMKKARALLTALA